MSVLFLAPGIRPGSGGVADYCCRLTEALTSKGVECHLASWSEVATDADSASPAGVQTLFLSQDSDTSVQAKAARLGSYIERHNVEWVSLQFVNFGFAKRGLIFGLAAALAKATSGRRLHIFLHELWVGGRNGAARREKLLGGLQRWQLLRLLKALKPEQIWTNIDLYATQLSRAGVQVAVVPIFGNIPMSTVHELDVVMHRLAGDRPPVSRTEYCFVGLFGTIDRSWPFQAVVPRLLRSFPDKKVVFVLFGRNGDSAAFESYVRSFPGADVVSLGELDEQMVDQVMKSMDVALATSPAEGTFKSGSAVAFLERGIPTVAVWHGLERGMEPVTNQHPSLVLADDSLAEKLHEAAAVRKPAAMLPLVADRYFKMFSSPRRGATTESQLNNK